MLDRPDCFVLVSIHPGWCKKIFDGEKTVEIRKTNPKCSAPFKVYIYCTMPDRKFLHRAGCMVVNEDELFRLPNGTLKHDWSGELMTYPEGTWSKDNFLNGKVIGEVLCDGIRDFQVFENGSVQNWMFADLDRSCLSYKEVAAYVGSGKTGYAWHLTNPVLYDAPKALWMFHRPCPNSLYCESCGMHNSHPAPGFCGNAALQIKRPPQSWCYVV